MVFWGYPTQWRNPPQSCHSSVIRRAAVGVCFWIADEIADARLVYSRTLLHYFLRTLIRYRFSDRRLPVRRGSALELQQDPAVP